MPETKIYRVIGLMSGTSLDGVDAAIIETDGETVFSIGAAVSLPYSKIERSTLENPCCGGSSDYISVWPNAKGYQFSRTSRPDCPAPRPIGNAKRTDAATGRRG